MTETSPHLQQIQSQAVAICGAEFVGLDGAGLTAAPADTAQAAQLLRLCDESRTPVSMEGSGSKSAWMEKAQPGLTLSTRRLNAVLEHTWQDMTCTVQAGCAWAAMQKTLEQHRQFVALDPLFMDRATVGGVVGANDSGALRLRYGGLRDLLIGMTVVLADGTVARSGGKVVKNVAGYDLPKLLCGSFGTLALITEVSFRLHSIAPHTVSLTATSSDASQLGKLLLRLLDSHFSIQSMQMRSEREGFALDVRLAALPDVLRTQTDGLIGAAASFGITSRVEESAVWSTRQALFRDPASSIVFKATMLPTEIGLAMAAVSAMSGEAVTQATGVMSGRVPVDNVSALTNLRAMLEAAEGSVVLIEKPEGVALSRWGKLPSSLPLMRAVKQHFDPNGILNPGRYVGNL